MKKSIRVLIVEDSEFDGRILVSTLRQGGYEPVFRRVETAETMQQALSEQAWDVILSDYNLPNFNAPAALQLLQDSRLDLPFIIISGGIGEDIAVAAMKAGAHDYLMKGNLARLVPAVEREMREATTRQAAHQAEAALRESEQRNRLLWENSTDAVLMLEPDGTIRFANPAVVMVFGFEAAQLVGRNLKSVLADEDAARFAQWASDCLAATAEGPRPHPIEAVGIHRQDRRVFLEIAFTPVDLHERRYVVAFIRDISERRRAELESSLLKGISLAVGTAPDLDAALAVVLRAICESTSWTFGQAWLPGQDGTRLECSKAWHSTSPALRRFRTVSETQQFELGEDLPGRAWSSRQPVWVDELGAIPNSSRAAVAREVGLIAGVAIPVVSGDEVVAVIEFLLTESRANDERTVQLFSAIAAQLAVTVQQRRDQQELLANEEEFRAARDIQERLFPKAAPVLPGVDIAGMSQAASATGGDYFDYLPLLDQRWGMAVGDVTGHGMGPALLMAETRAYLRVLAQSHREVEDILTAANRVLGEDIGADRFITMLLIGFDPATRRLTYASAGHPASYVLDHAGRIKATLRRTGAPLGIHPGTVYPPQAPIQLSSGDVVLLLTDGIDEAVGPGDVLFGVERVLDVVRANLTRPARDIVDTLFAEVRRFGGNAPQLDDATVVVMRVL